MSSLGFAFVSAAGLGWMERDARSKAPKYYPRPLPHSLPARSLKRHAMAIAISIRFAQALLLPPLVSAGTTSADLLRQAEERIQREQFSAAEALLEETIRQQAGNVQALYRLWDLP